MNRFSSLGLLAGTIAMVAATAPASAAPSYHARGTDGVFWFLHLSDSHIGTEWYPDADDHFRFALEQGVSVIKPWFVVVTGDLCDGSRAGIPTSGQDQKEWDLYRQIYQGAGMTSDFYFDLPGNHDGYGDVGMRSYLANSMQGSTNNALYASWVAQTPVGNYYFFGLNSAGDGSGPAFEDPEFTADEIADLEEGL
ncbi:MAG: metallophosphoesterase, partial [Polyangiaceae bacterium]|nr:metallophosphoesterase [Polyangiaceae bacterium]